METRATEPALPAGGDRGDAPLPVACALLERRRDGRLLVAQRNARRSLPLKWEFPGGKLEPGESAAEALRRELREELGIEAEIGAALEPVAFDYGAFAILLHPFLARVVRGRPRPREHLAVRWCTVAEIDSLDLAAADVPVLALYRRQRGLLDAPG